MQTPNIVIIGGGFSGLLIAHLLQKQGFTPKILEARSRLGGRIHTLRSNDEPPLEMGATWLGKKHHHLLDLLDDLGIDIYQQYMGDKGYYEPMSVSPPQLVDLPPNEEPSYRIAGGTDNLIQRLESFIDQEKIHLRQTVQTIRKTDAKLEIETESNLFKADVAISTLPPKLLVDSIDFSPSLPEKLTNIASKTHTWMAESIKVALTFEEPFWRSPDSSGTIFSNVGPVSEMYDHSTENQYALKGFMNNAYHAVSREERKQLVIEQLRRFYGGKIDSLQSYRELVWQKEPFSYSNYEQPIIPHQHNGHEIFQKAFLDQRLLIAGSETATEFPGYMDGVVESARRTVRQFRKLIPDHV
ncbi:flavin monoamine oxidase family protein [Gracilimonas mengyeensis]|uniref:Monoamine oxidase n=1 Tax=Gracilimonas mengyeensis TaxID=1302730 RepID=A0A521D8X4_9BACT|nr:NAD(P)/FAD-dependent oxidoreductase [Gracilimonas mengyeensis]SMO68128.1 monoamine oxidase [Gracilimonas mengyeensis]